VVLILKKYTWYFILLLVYSVTLVGCVDAEPVDTYGSDYTIYFANSAMTGHVPVLVDLGVTDHIEQIEAILELLKSGLNDNNIHTTIPDEVRVLNVELSNNSVTIDFSRDYTAMSSPIVEIVCRSSIVKTLTNIDTIDKVEFKIEGIPLKNSEGNIIGPMASNDIIMDLKDEDISVEETTFTIYLGAQNGSHLVPVQRTVKVDADLGYETSILQLIIEGPREDEEFRSTVPKTTEVKDIYIREGICYIDLSENFITDPVDSSVSDKLTIYSIVNSLAERYNISKVQFLIEGEIKEAYKGHFSLDMAFEPNWDIVQK
jgi:germination protein M